MTDLLKSKKKISGKYRVVQPIANFKVRIKIVQQKSPLAELFEDESETLDSNYLEHEEHEFSWQEKIFSSFEAKFYQDEQNCTSETHRDYRKRIKEQEIEGSRLYSYVQGDHYYPESTITGVLTRKFKSQLSLRQEAALPQVRNLKPFSERYNKSVIDPEPSEQRIAERHLVYRERETMYIMADLSAKDEVRTSSSSASSSDNETLLCALIYDRTHGVLTVSPDFCEGAEWYSVEGPGMSYDFWIEHASRRPTTRELQKRREARKRELRRLRAQKDSDLFHEFQLPQPRTLRLVLGLEIVAGHGFGYDAVFANYFVELPRHWSAPDDDEHRGSSSSWLAGRTQRCKMRQKTANFSYTAEIVLDLDLDAARADWGETLSWPRIVFSVASLDSWTRYRIEGYCALTIPPEPGSHGFMVRTWRPSSGFVDTLRRFFTGASSQLDDLGFCTVPTAQLRADSGTTLLDKSMVKAKPSGELELRLHLVHQSQSFLGEAGLAEHELKSLNPGTLLSSVDEVLMQFKAARERMIQARAMYS